ncbi:MarR family transcriptional regulator [Natronomonas gomsonensis]|uniref:MarR family winged helix-turn-helix transcriptional regulator n=1 Tax=Natronomonas gomsonensis TaxID=1046043 RepID=UPI0020CA4FE6|nr:MarR family transcriptional regulator [Natronomonas gomsonensis]MCY4730465.1 MarR family transcriptional regulator [Natronomonas gomsonensis]
MTDIGDSSVVRGGRAEILSAVAEEDRQSVSSVLDRVSLSRQYVSSTLQRLEDEGLVEKERSDDDKREKLYSITSEGQALIDVLDGIYAEA